MKYARKKGRVPSVKTCEEKKWGVGTVISAGKWKVDRQITKIGEQFVTIKILQKGVGTKERVRTFPEGVKRANDYDEECNP